MCLFAALLVGLAAAAWALSAGWHPLLALAVYSLSGSFPRRLHALSSASTGGRAAVAAAAADRLHALPAPQST